MNLSTIIFACATCMPDQGTPVTHAANMAILFMAGVIFLILGILIRTMFNFARRQRQQEESGNL